MKKSILLGCMLCGLGIMSSNAAWQPMEMKSYTNVQTNPVEVYFTPETDGVLTIKEWDGFADPYLWTNEACTESYFVPYESGSEGWDGEFITTYTLVAGHTYYSKAPVNENDNITEIEYSWVANSAGSFSTIEEGVPFKPNNQIWKFTAPETGVLSVYISPFVYGLVGSSWSFLYTNPGCTNYVPVMNPNGKIITNSDGSENVYYYFSVEEGVDYYFTAPSSSQFTFAMSEEELVVSVLRIDPTPGKSFDTVNYIGGAQIYFDPFSISYEKIEFQYTDKNGENVVVPVQGEFQSEALGLLVTPIYEEAMENALSGSSCTITVYGVNFNGTPLTVTNVANSTVENGNLSFSYLFEGPIELVNAEWPNPMLGYWPTGDPDGIATLTFSNTVKKVAAVMWYSGRQYFNSPSEDAFLSYAIPYEIEGNEIIIDFTGVARYDENNILSQDFDIVTIMVEAVEGENGLNAVFNGNSVLQVYLPYQDNIETGVNAITTDNDTNEIFNLQGMKINKAKENLEKGIYIINGTKTFVR